jgi:hypothetical protein
VTAGTAYFDGFIVVNRQSFEFVELLTVGIGCVGGRAQNGDRRASMSSIARARVHEFDKGVKRLL